MKRFGRPRAIVSDRLRTFGAAIEVIGTAAAAASATTPHVAFAVIYPAFAWRRATA